MSRLQLEVTEDKKFLKVTEAKKEEISQLKLSFKKRIKNHYFHPLVKKKIWDGTIDFMDVNNRIPVGLWKEVFEIGEKYGFEIEIPNLDIITNELDEADFDQWIIDFFPDEQFRPYDYQIDAVKKIIKMGRSVSEIATSGGKTLIMFCVYAYMKQRGLINRKLIVVPSISLVEQTYQKFIQYSDNRTKMNFSVQLIGGGNDKTDMKADLIIGTYQTLRDMDEDFFEEIDTVCVDECLHPDTLILMENDRLIPIKDLKIGDKVKTLNEDTKEIENKEIEYIYNNMSKDNEKFELEMEDGSIIIITGNHKVKTKMGWKRVDELNENDDIISFGEINEKM